MVARIGMPHHSLDALREAVRRKAIQLSRSADHRRLDLGYSLAEVCQCLLALTEQHFRKTHTYDHGICDDYLLSWAHVNQDGETQHDDLYIKVKLTAGPKGDLVAVISFHRQQ
jgi:hypothetical protein